MTSKVRAALEEAKNFLDGMSIDETSPRLWTKLDESVSELQPIPGLRVAIENASIVPCALSDTDFLIRNYSKMDAVVILEAARAYLSITEGE